MSGLGGETPGQVILCERKPFREVLFSPWGIVMLLLTPLTLGVSFLTVAGMHFLAMPSRVWVRGTRLFADKGVPKDGVDIGATRLELGLQQMVGATVNRWLRIYYRNENGKERFLNLNEMYFGADGINRVIVAGSAYASTESASCAVPSQAAVCTICGTVLRGSEYHNGLCALCQKRAVG
ncbi:MAG TPA: hypothetical protein VH682_17820 [Gemmataceae bacterium]|jgi:hypothetical protein